jgi:hypothetical protein
MTNQELNQYHLNNLQELITQYPMQSFSFILELYLSSKRFKDDRDKFLTNYSIWMEK